MAVIGVSIGRSEFYDLSILDAAKISFNALVDVNIKFAQALVSFFSQRREVKELTGPVGMVKFAGEQVFKGWTVALNTIVMISVMVAFFNLLPLRPLDGGHMASIVISNALPFRQVRQALSYQDIVVVALLAFFTSYTLVNDVIKLI